MPAGQNAADDQRAECSVAAHEDRADPISRDADDRAVGCVEQGNAIAVHLNTVVVWVTSDDGATKNDCASEKVGSDSAVPVDRPPPLAGTNTMSGEMNSAISNPAVPCPAITSG